MDTINQTQAGSKKSLYAIIGVIAVIIIGSLIFGTTRTVKVGDVSLDVTEKIDGSTTVKNDNITATYGSNKLPDNWPSDAPIYPNSTIIFSSTINSTVQLMFSTSDSNQAVINFYKEKLTASGWVTMYQNKPISSSQVGKITSINVKKKGQHLTLTISDTGDNKSHVTLMIVESGLQ